MVAQTFSLSYSVARALIVVAILSSLWPLESYAASPSREKLLAVYLFRLAEHVHWQNSSAKTQYRLHLIDKNAKTAQQLRGISKIRQLHGKDFSVSRGSSASIPADADLVFVSESSVDLYKRVFDQTQGRNVLLISEKLPQETMRYALINLRESAGEKLLFQVNKANIVARNFGVNPDIILLGGTEVDVAKLYTEGLQELETQNTRLKSLETEIESIQEVEKTLKREITSVTQEKVRSSQKLAEVETRLDSIKSQLVEAEGTIRQQNTLIEDKAKTIASLQSNVGKLQLEIDDKRKEIGEKEIQINDAGIKLSGLREQIDTSVGILEEKNRLVEQRTEQLNQQGLMMAEQQEFIDDQRVVIASQKNYLILASLVGVLTLLFFLLAYIGYRGKKKSNVRLRQYADELAEAKSTAEAHTTAKSLFLSNMSHELRSPLTSIIGFSHLMHNNADVPESIRKNVGVVKRSADHLLAIINDVLDMAKIESGQIDFVNEDVDLYALLRDTVDMMRMSAESKELYLDLAISSNCPALVHADGAKLRRVFINLTNNAIKFTDRGGVSIRVACHDADTASKIELKCEIEDTGIGIDEQKLNSIFKPFEQVIEAQKGIGWQQGTGLGLSLSKELIELMGGSIDVHSVPGEGSVFSFNVVVERATGAHGLGLSPRRAVVVDIDPGRPPVKALVVEDMKESAAYLQQILLDCRCEVQCVENGAQAVERFVTWKPDIVWMDRRMPVMDGVVATRLIRQQPGGDQVKIVAITASVFESEMEEVMRSGFDSFVRKPYLPDDVYDCLGNLLGVEFDVVEEDTEQPTVMRAEHIARLPDAVFDALEVAAKSLDYDAVLEVAKSLQDSDTEVADGILALVENYDFHRLQSLISKSGSLR